MTRHPLTVLQAEDLCKNFQYLKGESFELSKGAPFSIECVCVCPYDDISKYIFVIEYHKYKDAARALEMYLSPLYDVILIAEKGAADLYPVYMDLAAYLQMKGEPYEIHGVGKHSSASDK